MLKSLDTHMRNTGGYARYMDDWVIFTRSRAQCRRVIKRMHAVVADLKLRLAVPKTYIGRVANGFDFLGYRFTQVGLVGLARQTVVNHMVKLARLYEQRAATARVCLYVKYWAIWCRAGLTAVPRGCARGMLPL